MITISASHAGGPGLIPCNGRHMWYIYIYIYFSIAIYVFCINIYFFLLTALIHNINYNNATLELVLFSLVQFRKKMIYLYVFVCFICCFIILISTIVDTIKHIFTLDFSV